LSPDPVRRKKRLKAVFLALALITAAGYALSWVFSPFGLLLYFQAASLALAVVVLFAVRRDLFLLPLFLLWLAAYAFNQREAALALAVLFLAAFVGRGLIADARLRRRFTWAAAGLILCGFTAFLFFFRISGVKSPAALRAEAMKSLPYSSFASGGEGLRDGVAEYRKSAVQPGLNLYNSYYQPAAALLDMDGRVLHRWRTDAGGPRWHYVRLLPGGDLLVCVEDERLMRMDWNSRILWQTPMRAHHDIAVAADGDIYTLSGSEEMALISGIRVPVINEYIEALDAATGVRKRRLSFLDLFPGDLTAAAAGRSLAQIFDPRDFLWRILRQKSRNRLLLRRLTGFDLFHANALKILDRDVPGLGRQGDLLLSLRSLDTLAVVDAATGALRWRWGPGTLEEPHDPSLLPDGHILVFDNGTRRKYSRVLEIDPATGSIAWEYRAGAAAPFYSNWGGAAQRLPNGNTLVTESDDGRVFEVSRGGEIVWSFMNPDDGAEGKRATIYRMVRLTDPALVESLLKKIKR